MLHTVTNLGIIDMLSQITTKSLNVYLNNNTITLAKCRVTGRFVKHAIAQVELNAELKARSEATNSISFVEQAKKRHAAFTKSRLNTVAIENVNKAINNSLVEKAKIQLQASIAKVAMLGMITLSAFNFA